LTYGKKVGREKKKKKGTAQKKKGGASPARVFRGKYLCTFFGGKNDPDWEHIAGGVRKKNRGYRLGGETRGNATSRVKVVRGTDGTISQSEKKVQNKKGEVHV